MAESSAIPVQPVPETLSHLIQLNVDYSVLICLGHYKNGKKVMTQSRDAMKKHGNKAHGKKRIADEDLFDRVRLQSWFWEGKERYWVVDETKPQIPYASRMQGSGQARAPIKTTQIPAMTAMIRMTRFTSRLWHALFGRVRCGHTNQHIPGFIFLYTHFGRGFVYQSVDHVGDCRVHGGVARVRHPSQG